MIHFGRCLQEWGKVGSFWLGVYTVPFYEGPRANGGFLNYKRDYNSTSVALTSPRC